MKKRNTKRTLIGSLLMMLLSCSMLLGTTFAWFVDSETAQVGMIQSGTLKFDMQYALQPAEGGELTWRDAEDGAAFFGEGALWEPGYTGVVYIQITNTGSLALKYRCSVQVADNVIGQNQGGEKIDLRDYVWVGVTAPVSTPFENRTAAASAALNMQLLNNQISSRTEGVAYSTDASGADQDTLVGAGETRMFAVVVQMPDSTGNAANYAGDTAPGFKLKITVDAAQAVLESDSVGTNYDSNASYPAEITEASEPEESTVGASEPAPKGNE